jgi:xylulose-5-phosphate/fructose-6-phosphate phosphoketolase
VHCTKGLGIWARASTDAGEEPDVVLASCGDVATMEALAAAAILRERAPDLKLRFVNVVDLFKLQPASEHPHGSTDREFDSLFTTDKPIIFNFHGYPWLNPQALVPLQGAREPARRGLQGKGQHQHAARARDTERDDRFDLVIDVIDRVPRLRTKARAPEGARKQRVSSRSRLRRARKASTAARGVELDLAVLSRLDREAAPPSTAAPTGETSAAPVRTGLPTETSNRPSSTT